MAIRNTLCALLATAALLCAGAAHADRKIVSVDYGIEASTSTVLMPSSTAGSVVLTCDGCKARSFRLTNDTRYLIGTSSATFAQFSASLQGSVRNVVVFVKPDLTVTRIMVSAAAAR